MVDIVGNNDNKNPKKKKLAIIAGALLGAAIIAGSAYLLISSTNGGAHALTDKEKSSQSKMLKEMGVKDQKELDKKNIQVVDEIKDIAGGEVKATKDQSDSLKDNKAVQSYKNYVNNLKKNQNGNEGKKHTDSGTYDERASESNDTQGGGGSSSGENTDTSGGNEDNDTSDYIPLMIAELSMKTSQASADIKRSLEESDKMSMEYRILNADINFLNGTDKEPNWDLESVDDLKVDNWTRIAAAWLFNLPSTNFTWFYRTESSGEYINMYSNSLYNNSWDDLTSAALVIPENTTIGDYDVNAQMKFVSGGKLYTASYSLQNSNFLLLDVQEG